MPIGKVSPEEFEAELKESHKNGTPKNEPLPEIIEIERPGRKTGDVNVPDSLRKLIGEESAINGRSAALDLARMFGVSDSSVSAYAKGATSTTSYNQPDNGIKSHILEAKNRVAKRAGRKLNLAISHITDEKLAKAKVGELAIVAKSMSAVIKDMEPQQAEGGALASPQFVIYAPQFRDERSYQMVEADDN